MCMSMPDSAYPDGQNEIITVGDRPKKPADSAADVPLGDGMADAASRSIRSRRGRIEQALADAES